MDWLLKHIYKIKFLIRENFVYLILSLENAKLTLENAETFYC